MGQVTTTNTSKPFRACILGFALAFCTTLVQPKVPVLQEADATISVAELPTQGRVTYRLIREGGPFPFEKDGTVFGNRERLLPIRQRGYYREYTVKTTGIRSRGANRIVCGGPPQTPDGCYYSNNHYASFRKIIE